MTGQVVATLSHMTWSTCGRFLLPKMDKLSYNYQIWTQIWVRPDFFWTKKVQNPKFSAEQKGQIFEKSHQASSPIIRGPVLTNWPDMAYSNSDTRLIELPNSKVDDIHTPLTSHGMTIW
jgi:hypothetical protein